MKRVFYFVIILFLFSCKTIKEKHIIISYKLIDCLKNNESNYIISDLLFGKNVGHSFKSVQEDCKTMKQIVRKYGVPPPSNVQYIENLSDPIYMYTVDINFHSGSDTMQAWKISSVVLRVFFGSPKYYPPNKILDYDLMIKYDGLIKEDTILPEYQFLEDAFK